MPFRRVTVRTDVPSQIAPYNPARQSLVIKVAEGSPILISTDRIGLAESGFRMEIGDSISLTRAWGDEPHLELTALATGTASATLHIFEGFGKERE